MYESSCPPDSVTKHIKGVKLRARATGELIAKNLNLDASLKKAVTGKTNDSDDQPSNDGGNDNNNGGGGSNPIEDRP